MVPILAQEWESKYGDGLDPTRLEFLASDTPSQLAMSNDKAVSRLSMILSIYSTSLRRRCC